MAPLLTEFLNADATYAELRKKCEESKGGEKKALQRSLNKTRNSLTNKFHQTNKIGQLCAAAREEMREARVASRNFRNNCLLESAAYTAANKVSGDAKKALEDRKKKLCTEYRGKSKLFQEAQGLRNRTRELESALKTLTENATATGTADVDKKVVEATIALKEAAAKAHARYQPQLSWIGSFTYQINGGYYNYNHGKYYSHYAMKKLGGGEVRNNLQTVRKIYDGWQKKGDWHTEVDWDWRMKEEIDGSIHKAPQMKRWLVKTRGPVK